MAAQLPPEVAKATRLHRKVRDIYDRIKRRRTAALRAEVRATDPRVLVHSYRRVKPGSIAAAQPELFA